MTLEQASRICQLLDRLCTVAWRNIKIASVFFWVVCGTAFALHALNVAVPYDLHLNFVIGASAYVAILCVLLLLMAAVGFCVNAYIGEHADLSADDGKERGEV
jgi:hypothetical protein